MGLVRAECSARTESCQVPTRSAESRSKAEQRKRRTVATQRRDCTVENPSRAFPPAAVVLGTKICRDCRLQNGSFMIGFHAQIDKLSRKDGELQALSHHNAELEERVENLRQEYQRAVDARNSLQRQVQQLLANREDFDALKTSVQLLRTRLLHATRTAHSGDRSAQSSTTNIDHRSTQSTFAQINDQKTSAMSSPKPSIIAKMTQSPGAAPDGSNLAEAVTLQDKSSGPHWYSKLRS